MDAYNDEAMDQDDNTSGQNKEDYGLFLLLPLYKFLRANCAQIIFKIVVTKFQECRFLYDNEDAKNHLHKNLHDFLKAIHTKGTNRIKKIKSKNTQEKQSWQIYNLKDNEKILQKITVNDMLAADEEKCQPLKTLDLNFLLNIVFNATLQYPLSASAKGSIHQLIEIRNGLMHAKYNFSRKDFDKNLQKLQETLQVIYKYFNIPHHDLDMQIEECKKETTNPDTSLCLQIHRDLQMEIHNKYKSPQNFVCPSVREACDGEEPYVESLKIYIRHHNSKPILLCGKRGSGKTSILQNQAYELVQKLNDAQDQGDQTKISLVLLFAENHQGPLKKENFWENVTRSMKNLAPKTAEWYGIETLMVVIKMHIKETIFFVNWSLQDITTQFQDTSNGTWVFTYDGYPVKSADWNILITEPLNDTQVYQLLQSLNPNPRQREIIHEKYRVCKYKAILTTPDMVKIFNEINSKSESGTEFELMINYVKEKMDEGKISKEIIRAIGKLSFSGIRQNKQKFWIDEVEKDIAEPGQVAFFTKDGDYFELIHNTLMDFFASVYVIDDLDKACKEWLDNTSIFKRVFKFACSFWFRDVNHCWKETVERNGKTNDYLKIMEVFLCKFLSVEKFRTERKKDHKSNKIDSSSKMEVDGNNLENNTNDSMDMDVNIPANNTNDVDISNIEETEMLMSGNPVKNPFSKWGFLVHIDEACGGKTVVLEMLADLLSFIRCWVFKCKLLDDSKRSGVQKILEKVKLNQKFPVTIRIESGPNCNMLMNIWNMLKNTESLYNAVKVKISIMHEKKEGKYQISNDRPLKEIVNARTPVYITELSMPVISPKIPDFKFSMCGCIQKLEYLDANVYDVNSLREVLACGKLPNMKSLKIYVDLKASEQNINKPPQLEIPNPNTPKNLNVNLTIVYFKEIQKLLNSFTCRHRLLSLSIHGLVVVEGFMLDISAFKYMESLYLHCDSNYNVPLKDNNCALLLILNLILPKQLERLLLSKVQFYNDTNIHLFRNFFAKYNIQRLMILDSNLSLEGACMVLKQHMFQEKETELHIEMSKKMKIDKSDSTHSKKVIEKQPRLSKKIREEKKKNKPKGKEIIVTSNMELLPMCNLVPCQCRIQCTTMLNPSDILKKKLKDLSVLIEDTYCFSILSFAFNNKNIIVRKDLCNDVRVHCPLFKIQDDDMYQIQQMIQGNEIPSNSPILQLFQSLTLTQSLYIEKTALSYDGISTLVTLLKNYKRKLFQDNEPFSLTVTSDNLPCGDVHGIKSEVRNSRFIKDLKRESCLQMLNVWCTHDDRCHRLKKTHDGDIFLNDTMIYRVRS